MRINNVGLIIAAGLVVVAVIFGTMFSIIGSQEEPQVCEVTDPSVPCVFDLEVSQNRALSLFTGKLDFESVPEVNYKGEQQLTAFATSTEFTEEDDMDAEDRNYRDYEKFKVYLYRMPASWGVPYEIEIDARSTGVCKINSDQGDCEVDIDAGIVTINYPYNTVEVCDDEDNDNCNNDNYYFVQTYDRERDGRPDESQVNFYNDYSGEPIEREDLFINSLDEVGSLWTQPIYNRVVVTDVPSRMNFLRNGEITDWNSQFAMFVTTIVTEDNSGFVDQASIQEPVVVTAKYKEAVYPSNVKYRVGGEGIFYETFQGAQTQEQLTLDFANQINEYCGRNDGDAGRCVVPLEVYSDTIGKITFIEESTTLSVVEGDTENAGEYNEGDENIQPGVENPGDTNGGELGNQITGAVTFDFENYPIGAWSFVGILFVGLIALIAFFPTGGKKK